MVERSLLFGAIDESASFAQVERSFVLSLNALNADERCVLGLVVVVTLVAGEDALDVEATWLLGLDFNHFVAKKSFSTFILFLNKTKNNQKSRRIRSLSFLLRSVNLFTACN